MTGAVDHPTSPGIEAGVAVLLGADREVAEAAVAAVDAAALLGVGVALPALLIAARRGTDAVGALRRLADGDAVPTSWSPFEARVATDEAREEAAAARARMRLGVGTVEALGLDAAVVAVEAVLGGAATVVAGVDAARARGVAETRARVDHAWIVRVVALAPQRLVAAPARVEDAAAGSARDAALRGGGDAAAEGVAGNAAGGGEGAVVVRRDDYLDLFDA